MVRLVFVLAVLEVSTSTLLTPKLAQNTMLHLLGFAEEVKTWLTKPPIRLRQWCFA